MSEPFIGEVDLFGFNFVPETWGLCAGALMSINDHQALFSLIGTLYGGDGRTSFALPDLRGKVAVSAGTPPGNPFEYKVGTVRGQEMRTLSVSELNEHSHAATFSTSDSNALLTVSAAEATQDVPDNGSYIASSATEKLFDTNDSTATVDLGGVTGGKTITGDVALHTSGNSDYFSIMQPLLALNYCIALKGLFPSRN